MSNGQDGELIALAITIGFVAGGGFLLFLYWLLERER